MDPFIILLMFLIMAIVIAFAIGGNDETFSCVWGSKTLNMRQTLIFATIFAILGAFILGAAVSKTIGKKMLYIEITTAVVLTILISTAIWLILASALGLPISTTHATIGAIIGIGIFIGRGTGVNWAIILEMSIWWILSPIIGFVVTYVAYKLIHKYHISKLNGFEDYERAEKNYSYVLLIIICITAFARAGNDCSNAVGIVAGVGDIEIDVLLLITGLSLASGVVILGRSVIKEVGKMTELRPSTAFAAQIPTAGILFVGTLRGIPLSGSHMLVASLIGLAVARRAPYDKKGFIKIMIIWLLTFPISAILAVMIYFPVSSIF